jgi:hypothetical protein
MMLAPFNLEHIEIRHPHKCYGKRCRTSLTGVPTPKPDPKHPRATDTAPRARPDWELRELHRPGSGQNS